MSPIPICALPAPRAGLSGLAVWLLEAGDVDAIVRIKADPDRAAGNVATVSRTRAEVHVAAGSRYAPASPLAILPDLPCDLRRLAFVGKPCDAAALRALTAQDPALAARFPFILSFFCAGTPSLKGSGRVLSALETAPADAMAFRYRGNGWSGRATVTRHDGSQASMSYQQSWGEILSKHVQHRCKICADGTGVADERALAAPGGVPPRRALAGNPSRGKVRPPSPADCLAGGAAVHPGFQEWSVHGRRRARGNVQRPLSEPCPGHHGRERESVARVGNTSNPAACRLSQDGDHMDAKAPVSAGPRLSTAQGPPADIRPDRETAWSAFRSGARTGRDRKRDGGRAAR